MPGPKKGKEKAPAVVDKRKPLTAKGEGEPEAPKEAPPSTAAASKRRVKITASAPQSSIIRDSRAHATDAKPSASQEAAEITRLKKIAFLAAYASCGRITKASEAAGINQDTHYEWRKVDPEYDADFGALRERVADILEDEAVRRAVDGETEPLIGRVARDEDGIITTVQKRSDKLLEILLKANRPEKFRERYELTGKNGAPLHGDLSGLSEDELILYRGLVAKISGKEKG